MSDTIDREAFLERLRSEYVESLTDRLQQLDELLDRFFMGVWSSDDLLDMQREVHSIKGSAGTYGFSSITAIAHRMEDYIETATDLDKTHLNGMQAHLDAIRGVIESGTDPSDDALRALLEDLPSSAQSDKPTEGFSDQTVKEIRVLLAMPRGIQRKIVGTELASCGLRVNVADTGISALERGLTELPDIVVTAMELPDMSGGELTGIFQIMKKLKGCRLIVMTSYDLNTPQVKALPDGVAVVRKGEMFIEDLSRWLIEWKILS